jgi:hypothetical protein
MTIYAQPHEHGNGFDLPDDQPENTPSVLEILAAESRIMPSFGLRDNESQQSALLIKRHTASITDAVIVNSENHWLKQIPENRRTQCFTTFIPLVLNKLKVVDTEAQLGPSADYEWSRYRDAQQAILASLETTLQTVTTEFTRRTLEAETAAKEKYDQLEQELNTKYDERQAKLSQEHAAMNEELSAKDAAFKSREESFNTKEARYVARHQQQEQIDQIKGWLNEWNLTRGTSQKRWPVTAAYAIGALMTGGLTVWFNIQIFELLKNADLSKLLWWQWALLTLKSLAPTALFITFVIYFIRWTSAWARIHAEEEFRNRARILDIGRTAWLLEAVRDAQDNNKDLPSELLKDLSRNLFAYTPVHDGDEIHPQAVSDLLTQGLASIRIKSADGAEIEASRKRK